MSDMHLWNVEYLHLSPIRPGTLQYSLIMIGTFDLISFRTNWLSEVLYRSIVPVNFASNALSSSLLVTATRYTTFS